MSTNVPPLDKKSSLSKLEPITPFYNKHSRGYSTSRSSQEPVTSITRRSFSAKSTSSFQKYGPPVNDFQPISPRRRRNTIMKLSEALKFNPITKLQKIEYNKIKINERIPETVLDLAHSTCQNTNINEMDIERDIEQFNLETKNTKTDHPPLDLNHMKTDIGKLISLYYNYHLFLFEDEKRVGNIKIPFDDNDVTDCRICVHTMELTHMELLRCFIKILENVKDSNEFIIETFCKLILKKGYRNAFAIDSFVKMGTFIEVCKIKESEVFGLQTRDPFYIIDGNSMVLSEASNEILMKLVFSRTQETSNFMEDYIHFTPYITNFEETFENFVKILNNLNQQSKEVSYSKDWMIFCISRFEKMIIYWLSVMEDAIYKQAPKLFNRIGNVIGSSNILTSQFKKEISLLLQRYSNVKDVTNQFHPYDKNHVQMIFGENRCSIINTTESGDVSNVFEIIDKIKLFLKTVETEEVTKQLILFDQETLSKVCTYDLYLKNTKGSLDRYIKGIQSIEDILLDILEYSPTKKHLMKCIKIAKRCLDYNDFNLSYIFYSVLSKISTTQRSTWNKLDKKFIQRYDNLQEIFSIRRNHNNYRILYESRPYPKIPILSLWMHDIVNINEISTFNGEDKKYVNFNKIRLLSTHLKSLKTPQMTKFPFERDDGIVNLLLKLTMI